MLKQSFAHKIVLYTAAVAMFAGAALAQQKTDPTTAKADAPVAGVVKLGVAVAEAELVAAGYRARKLIGAAVYNDQDQRVGKIEDLVIAPDGKVSVAVIDVGGFLGVAAHRVAIPVEQFSKIHPKVVLPGATKQALKELPEFKYAEG